MTAAAKLNAKIASNSTEALMDICMGLASDVREEAAIVTNAAMDALMARMTEDAFVAFCGEVEAAMDA